MVIIIPTNSEGAQGRGSSAGVTTVLQTATAYIYDPDITTVVYGFNGGPWPTFCNAWGRLTVVHHSHETAALLLNQLSRPVEATACEIDVNEWFSQKHCHCCDHGRAPATET